MCSSQSFGEGSDDASDYLFECEVLCEFQTRMCQSFICTELRRELMSLRRSTLCTSPPEWSSEVRLISVPAAPNRLRHYTTKFPIEADSVQEHKRSRNQEAFSLGKNDFAHDNR